MHLFIRAASALLPYMISLCSPDDPSATCIYGIWGKSNNADTTFLSYTDHSNLGGCNATLGCEIQPLRADISKGSDGTWTIYDETSTFPLGITTDATLMSTKTLTFLVATSTQSIIPFYYDTASLVVVTPTATSTSKTSATTTSKQAVATGSSGGSSGSNSGSGDGSGSNNNGGSSSGGSSGGPTSTSSSSSGGGSTRSSSGATASHDFAQFGMVIAMMFAAVAAPLAVL